MGVGEGLTFADRSVEVAVGSTGQYCARGKEEVEEMPDPCSFYTNAMPPLQCYQLAN